MDLPKRIQANAMFGALAGNVLLAMLSTAADHSEVTGLGADYVVVDRWGFDDRQVLSDAPSLVRLPDGALLCAYPRIGDRQTGNLRVFRSEDDGQTWQQVPDRVAFSSGRLFLHEGKVYYLGIGPSSHRDRIQISRSEDGGRSWAAPVTLFEGRFYCTSTAMVIDGGTLYWAYGTSPFNAPGSRIVAVAGNLDGDLLDPDQWRISNKLAFPPDEATTVLDRPGFEGASRKGDNHWLEPNVVKVGDRLLLLVRCRISRYHTSGIAGVAELEDVDGELQLSFAQFHPLPGAQCQFHIVHDDQSGLFWMTSNPVTNSQDLEYYRWLQSLNPKRGTVGFRGAGSGAERRILGLYYSLDALNWFQAGIVAMSRNPMRGFHYTTPLVDGDDLLIVSRTASGDFNQHDNDMITFHRVQDFRTLAVELRPTHPSKFPAAPAGALRETVPDFPGQEKKPR